MMIKIAEYVQLLKEHNLFIRAVATDKVAFISGKPVMDSRQVNQGDVFFCIKGLITDGHKYIQLVKEAGASLIILEDEIADDFPSVQVTDTRKAAALLANLYYGNPSEQFFLIGVTGTNGKTTTSMLIWQALTSLGYKTGWIGTHGYIINKEIDETEKTTPDIMELNEIFNKMAESGCRYVVMEVSSHALALDRVYGVKFQLALFINLSREHLDFHKTMDNYFESKYKLIEYTCNNNGTIILNSEDEYGRTIYKRIAGKYNVKTIAFSDTVGDYTITNHRNLVNGCEFVIKESDTTMYKIFTNLIGRFNVINITMSIAALKVIIPQITIEEIKKVASNLKPVRGRMEHVANDRNLKIYIDYAHTPEALKSALETLKQLPHERIVTVFGAGGDRDKGKRPEMLRQALIYSDCVILTDDNPRTENPNQIIRDIIGDNEIWKPWWVVRDRNLAINSALKLAQENDIVLIAGKGPETYQEVRGIRTHFDDVERVKQFLDLASVPPEDGELPLPVYPVMLESLYQSNFVFGSEEDSFFRHISSDSRTVLDESLFFALPGENYNGMDYVTDVLSEQTNGAVISSDNETYQNTIRCADTVEGLSLLAKKYLLMFPALRIAVTGSTGKTTTKEYMANIFTEQGYTLKTHANENNIIGLCKTIFRIKPHDKTAIFELGTNHFGEIGRMADVCMPEIAMVTNIGPSHLEFLVDEAGVYKEETEVFRRDLKKLIYPGDDKRFDEFKTKGISVGFCSECNYQISEVSTLKGFLEFKLNNQIYKIKSGMAIYVTNIALAITCAIENGVSEHAIHNALKTPITLHNRMEIKTMNKRLFIIDCYNANPFSMKAALEFWQSYYTERPHIAILGDMLELGEKSIEFHKNVGEILNNIDFELLITVGDFSRHYAKRESLLEQSAQNNHKHYKSVDELLKNSLFNLLPENSVILVKASHSIGLEKVLDEF